MDTNREQALQKLTTLVKDIKVCMLTTIEADGLLHSRPMGTLDMKDGYLWFFVRDDSRKAVTVQHDPRVNISYVDANTWVSVSGTATLTHDRAKIAELWTADASIWFPQGANDPHLALMQVRLEEGEYWDVTSSTMVRIFGYLKAKITGEAPSGEFAEHEVVRR